MATMEALELGLLMLLLLSIGRTSNAEPAVAATNPAATTTRRADPLAGLLAFTLLILVLLDVSTGGG